MAMYDQQEEWKGGDGKSVMAAVDRCAARDVGVHEWTAKQVQEWANARGGIIAKLPFETNGIDGKALMKLRGKIEFTAALGTKVVAYKNLRKKMSNGLACFPLPSKVLDGVLRASLHVDVHERASAMMGSPGPLGALRDIKPDPRAEAARESAKVDSTETQVTETMGGLTRLAVQQGRADDALCASQEWLGVAKGGGRETALAACCQVLESHGALTTFDFSRQVKRHWYGLETDELRPLWAAVTAPPGALERMTSVNLYAQGKFEGEMEGALPGLGRCTALQTLNLYLCSGLSGAIPESLGQCAALQTLDLEFCEGLSGAIPESLRKVPRLSLP